MPNLDAIAQAVEKGRAKKMGELTEQALADGYSAKDILNAMIDSMGIVGEKFKNNQVFVPEVMMSARAMKVALEQLRPLLLSDDVPSAGKIVIGTVAGDSHDIGKNLVGMMLEGAGFEVIDLGVDVSAEKFIEALQEKDARLLGMSALLTTTMPQMRKTIEALEVAGLRGEVKVMIGGAPVTQAYADQIEADGYSSDAASAVDLAKVLIAQ